MPKDNHKMFFLTPMGFDGPLVMPKTYPRYNEAVDAAKAWAQKCPGRIFTVCMTMCHVQAEETKIVEHI